MTASTFDPSQHLSKVNGQDYLEVKWRLVWLRSEHPEASIVTDLAFNDGNRAIFSARVEIPGGGISTGWGSETIDSFGNYIEKAETKAIGRALAAVGFGTQFCTEFEDGPEVGMLADSPVQLRRNTGSRNGLAPVASSGTQPVTDRQLNLIQALRRDLRIDVGQLDELANEVTGHPVAEMNRTQASSLIGVMKERISSAPGRQAS
jgi:hypothetical protein